MCGGLCEEGPGVCVFVEKSVSGLFGGQDSGVMVGPCWASGLMVGS